MKKGFTLIELLAVIVILAIVALITVPIVTGTITSSKTKTYEISVKNYIKAIESSLLVAELDNIVVPNGTYQIMNNGNICIGELNGTTCTKVLKVDIDGEKPISGTATLTDYKVTELINLKFNTFTAQVAIDGKITIVEGTTKCELVEEATNTAYNQISVGDKVKCGTEYFYVMPDHQDAPTGSVSLLAEKNITLDSTPVQSSTAGTIDFTNDYSAPYWLSHYGHGYFTYPTNFVYDSNSNLYIYVESYKEYLITNGTNIIAATVPSYDQMIEVGCIPSSGGSTGSCLGAQEWVFSTNYWTGSVGWPDIAGDGGIWHVLTSDGFFGWDTWSGNYYGTGIRPVIIINESDIK